MRAYSQATNTLMSQESQKSCYGISSGNPMRLIDLIAIFEETTKISLPITLAGRPYRYREVMKTWQNYTRLPGWGPQIQFRKGLLTSKPQS